MSVVCKFLLNDYFVLYGVLNPAKNKTGMEGSCLCGAHILVEETDIKQTKPRD